MDAAILTIGDEILNGSTIDTNSAFIGEKCNEIGLNISCILSVNDTAQSIKNGLDMMSKNASIIFITGGLGPTQDDITKQTLAGFFEAPLIYSLQQEENILNYFKQRGRTDIFINDKQKSAPRGSELLPNTRGTALGIWMAKNDKIFIAMPGVPHEMKNILTEYALPKIQTTFSLPYISHKYVLTVGKGESKIATEIDAIVKRLPSNINIAYLPSLGKVKIRLTGKGKNKKEIEAQLSNFQKEITNKIGTYAYSNNPEETLAKVLGNLLVAQNATVTTAESCTGGKIAHKITATAGSSAYYEGSTIAYSYDIKEKVLQVKKETLHQYGAVSKATVLEMVKGALLQMNTTYAIAVSGIAGPGGGTPEKPVGTVWIAVGDKKSMVAKKYQLTPHRDNNIEISSIYAIELLRQFMLDTEL